MIYKIFDHGEEINRIVADEEFVSVWCPENGYTYELEPETASEMPTSDTEQLRADVDFMAAMLGVEL